MTPDEALDKAAATVGSMQALAEGLGVTKGAVGQWKLPGRRVPAEHCPTIERMTNSAVLCEQLRPDVDWAVVRGKPEEPPCPNRRSTDPEPTAGRAGRTPPSRDNVMTAAADHAAVTEPKP